MKYCISKYHLLITSLILIIITTVSPQPTQKHFGIPIKENLDSKFAFSLEMYNGQTLLDCAGDIIVRKIEDHLMFTYENFDLNRYIGENRTTVNIVVKVPVLVKLDESNKMLDPTTYDEWEWIDPRMVIKLFQYSNIAISGRIEELGWETADDIETSCWEERKVQETDDTVHIKSIYILENCLANMDGVALSFSEHYRVIDFFIDKERKWVYRMAYDYKKKTAISETQTTVYLEFVEFVEIS